MANVYGPMLNTGGVWRPIQGLSLRGTYSNSFRAPSISDLYTGQTDSFENISDPCSGVNGLSRCVQWEAKWTER